MARPHPCQQGLSGEPGFHPHQVLTSTPTGGVGEGQAGSQEPGSNEGPTGVSVETT